MTSISTSARNIIRSQVRLRSWFETFGTPMQSWCADRRTTQPAAIWTAGTSRAILPTVMGTAPIVIVHLPGPLRPYAGGLAQLSLPAATVRVVLEDLERSWLALYRNICDESGAVRRHLNVFVNSDNIRDLDGVDTALSAGDVLTFLPAVSGG